ncbi:hypothetical protein GGR56DRAFT_462799 [Xylariaceae sp. FL0804]|nr:hypothetical protein GGR56DRAFT_462799 [Xylariaceae sp. FL0804]
MAATSLPRALAAAAGLVASARAADVLSFSVDDSPSNASAVVDPSFAGFGIEPSQLFNFMGFDEANKLSVNMLTNLAGYTGQPPSIRIGGNTQDLMIYNASMDDWKIASNQNSVGKGKEASDSMIIGPRYLEAANRMPQGTPVTWGLNLAFTGDGAVDYVVSLAQAVVDQCDNLNLVSFEIGNEVDIYTSHNFRTEDDWNGQAYVTQWRERAAAIYAQVLEPQNISTNFFDGPCSTAWVAGTTFEIDELVEYGMLENAEGSDKPYLAAWDQHDYYYFLGNFDYPITLEYMMQFNNTATEYQEALGAQMTQAAATNISGYQLREMGVVGPVGLNGVSDTFAAALWTLNFLFYAATLNVTSVQFDMTANSNASAWQPGTAYGNEPHVRPLYYGMAAFDQVIGASCAARVAEAQIDGYPSGYDAVTKAYAVYQGSRLGSITVLNGMLANASQTDKASMTVSVTLPTALASETVYLSYLSAEGADSTSGATWNGLSYEESAHGTSTDVDDVGVELDTNKNGDRTAVVGDDGTLTLTVRDTQAVVASFGQRVGSTDATSTDTDACSAVVTQGVGATRTNAASSSSTSSGSSKSSGDGKSAAPAGMQHGGGAALSLLTVGTAMVAGAALLLV